LLEPGAWLTAGLGLAQASAREPFKARDEILRAERVAGALGDAQRCEDGAVRARFDEFGKAADAVEDGRYAYERVVASGEMRPRARPRPVLGTGLSAT